MAQCNKKPICVINHKAELLSYYESIDECIKLTGFPKDSVYHAVQKRKIYRCMLFIPEPEYREHWEKGTLDELSFKTRKQRNYDSAMRMIQARANKEVEERRKKKISEKLQQRKQLGLPMPYQQAVKSIVKPVMCVESGIIYPSVTEASRQIGVANTVISRAIKKSWRVHGLKYKYVNDSIIETQSSSPT